MTFPSQADRHALRGKLPAAAAVLLLASLGLCPVAFGQELTMAFVGPSEAVPAGETVGIWLIVLNASDRAASHAFPAQLDGRLHGGGADRPAIATLRNPAEAGEAVIPPQGYARREYVLTVPEGLEGQVLFSAAGIPANPVGLEVRRAETSARAGEQAPAEPPIEPTKGAGGSSPEDFFKAHIFGYEPFYFIAGTGSPNAKFQISLKYRLLNVEGPLARRFPALLGFHLAYTQTSLWDVKQASAPFLDTSYKPEFLYAAERVDGGRWADWLRLDLQAGVQHESNGKGGGDSRGLNLIYFQPTVVLGKPENLQLTLSPRVWAYLGSVSDNPDIRDYRGYVGLRTILGWAKGLQLSATGRLGDDANRGSVQVDLSYPLMRVLWGNFSFYLYAQLFTGYGESLLQYNQRSTAFRAGFAFFR